MARGKGHRRRPHRGKPVLCPTRSLPFLCHRSARRVWRSIVAAVRTCRRRSLCRGCPWSEPDTAGAGGGAEVAAVAAVAVSEIGRGPRRREGDALASRSADRSLLESKPKRGRVAFCLTRRAKRRPSLDRDRTTGFKSARSIGSPVGSYQASSRCLHSSAGTVRAMSGPLDAIVDPSGDGRSRSLRREDRGDKRKGKEEGKKQFRLSVTDALPHSEPRGSARPRDSRALRAQMHGTNSRFYLPCFLPLVFGPAGQPQHFHGHIPTGYSHVTVRPLRQRPVMPWSCSSGHRAGLRYVAPA